MELGCFLAGVIISAQDHELADEVEHLIEPVKDFLSVIFFASIGMCKCACIHTCTCTHTHTHTHTVSLYMYPKIYTHIYTYRHTYTHMEKIFNYDFIYNPVKFLDLNHFIVNIIVLNIFIFQVYTSFLSSLPMR